MLLSYDICHGLKISHNPSTADEKPTERLELSTYYMLGIEHYQTAQYQDALDAFKKALAMLPNPSASTQEDYLHYSIAQTYAALKQYSLAFDEIEKALTINDKRIDYYLTRIDLYLIAEKNQQALAQCNKALKIEPFHERVAVRKADILLKMKKHNELISFSKSYIRHHPKSVLGYLFLGKAYMSKQHMANAKKSYEKALRIDPHSFDALLALATLYETKGNIEKSLEYYSLMYDQKPDPTIGHFAAQIALENHKLTFAYNFLEKILLNNENDRAAKTKQIDILLQQKHYDEALGKIATELKKDPYWAHLYFYLGAIEFEKKHYKEAEANFKKVSPQDRLYYKSILYINKILVFEKKYNDAIALLKKTLENLRNKPNDPLIDPWLQHSTSQRPLNETNPTAFFNPEYTYQYYEDWIEIYLELANLYAMTHQHDIAINTVQEANLKFPQTAALLFPLGNYHEELKHYSQADEAFKELLTLQPQVEFLTHYGYLLLNRTTLDPQQAATYLKAATQYIHQAVRLNPKLGTVQKSLGWLYFKTKKYKEAAQKLEYARKLNPEDITILDHLADTYYQLDLPQETRKLYREALSKKNISEKLRQSMEEKVYLLSNKL